MVAVVSKRTETAAVCLCVFATLNLYEFAFCFYDYFMAFTQVLFIWQIDSLKSVEEGKEEKTRCIHKIVVQKASNKITNNGRLS